MWTKVHLEALLKSGKIKGFTWVKKEKGNKNPKMEETKRGFSQKKFIYSRLMEFAMAKGYLVIKEHVFAKELGRKWRFDFCIEEIKLAVEYNGMFSKKSRHLTVTGHTGDVEKINAAQNLGFTVWQYTAMNYKNIENDLANFR